MCLSLVYSTWKYIAAVLSDRVPLMMSTDRATPSIDASVQSFMLLLSLRLMSISYVNTKGFTSAVSTSFPLVTSRVE